MIFNIGREWISCMLKSLVIAQIVLLAVTTQSWGAKAKIVNVNCGGGQTITDALRKSDGTPITIVVSGTCYENVAIAQDDVTLVANPPLSGAVSAADPNSDAIAITGVRAAIDGLKVTRGRHGVMFAGGKGIVDNCAIQENALHGIVIRGGSAAVTNSAISGNGGAGITVGVAGSAQIGFKYNSTQYAGNNINGNGGSGIFVSIGSGAQIAGNEISGNGITRDPAAPFERAGVWVANGSGAFLAGGNTITNNIGSGVLAQQSSAGFSDGRMIGLPLDQYMVMKIRICLGV
jgi:hypothetical protein